MSTTALPHGALQPRPPGGLLPGAGLSLVVHAGLVVAIALGVSWQRSTPVEFSAELWSALPEVAAPRTVAPESTPAPPPAPAPTPAPPPPAPTRSAADIALERERAAQREQAEREARLRREREAEAKRAKAAEEAALKRQRELQKQREEELARKAEEERQEKQREAQRQENLKRLLAQAGGGSGGPSSTGTAARNAAPSQQYGGILREHVRSKLKFSTASLPATLETVVEIRATASGNVLSRRVVRRSGNDAWDNAVLRAIDAASPLPRDKDGTTPGSIEIVFRPVD
ncbi:MAG: TonB C-terminal domain-containing protein [Burkholderiaceae bacterium]|nr:TonB C-terminal domain-containing protein [Burkholderiaceae bacterium]